MKSQFVIFVIIGTLLVAAIYSVSVSVVFALKWKGEADCVYNEDYTKSACCWEEGDTVGETMTTFCTSCEKNQETGNWDCTPKRPINSGHFPFTDFLEEDGGTIKPPTTPPKEGSSAVGPSVEDIMPPTNGENKTKVPKSDLLNDGGLLKGQGDNQTTSKTIVGPQDRFCEEGTGGDTGNPCLPCDPGLKFAIGCIDVTTGGPLDMPDAATSESGESDDTNPKDLDGPNNDDNGPEVNPGE